MTIKELLNGFKSAEVFVILNDVISFCKADFKTFYLFQIGKCTKVKIFIQSPSSLLYKIFQPAFEQPPGSLIALPFLPPFLQLSRQASNSSVRDKSVFVC